MAAPCATILCVVDEGARSRDRANLVFLHSDRAERTCGECGHDDALHDEYGCAAWLGAFVKAEPGQVLGYCRCRLGRGGVPAKPPLP
jgi:hypothetical protein